RETRGTGTDGRHVPDDDHTKGDDVVREDVEHPAQNRGDQEDGSTRFRCCPKVRSERRDRDHARSHACVMLSRLTTCGGTPLSDGAALVARAPVTTFLRTPRPSAPPPSLADPPAPSPALAPPPPPA